MSSCLIWAGHFEICLCAKSLQSHSTLCNPMDCSLLDSSVHEILQAKILEWVAIPSSKGSSQPRDRTHIHLFCLLHWQVGEGNGTPLQYFCLENPMDGGAWWAAVHGVARVGHDWATSLSLFTFLHWRRKWKPTPVFLPGESQGRGSLVGCHL